MKTYVIAATEHGSTRTSALRSQRVWANAVMTRLRSMQMTPAIWMRAVRSCSAARSIWVSG